MSILGELYYGNICPMEKHLKADGEYSKLLTKAADLMEKFNESLSEEDKSMWNEINDMQSEDRTQYARVGYFRLKFRFVL